MRTLGASWMIAAAVWLGVACGCSPQSLSPIVSAKDAIADDRVVGRWRTEGTKPEDDAYAWTIRRAEGSTYELTCPSRPDAATGETKPPLVLSVRLTKIGAHVFADLSTPVSVQAKAEEVTGLVLSAPVHCFGRAQIEEGSIRWRDVSPKWLDGVLRRDDHALAHAHLENKQTIITATTEELRAFLLKHADDDAAYEREVVLKRVVETPAGK
jgi:hypothetical protein